jgi:nondiscriminating glutamyl-tRNA synthetase
MTSNKVRVRFAPAPTGWMHLGNVRAAFINALFAKQTDGTMVLRIEDTDAERIIDAGGKQIMAELNWLGIHFDEGPYFQSQRTEIYNKYLQQLIDQKAVYRAFETPEELEIQRAMQLAQGLPPRYNRASLHLTDEEIQKKLEANVPFVWRFKLPHTTVTFHDIAHGDMTFDLSNISDFAVTRQDGSITFIFANFIDDMLMQITHVIRGEDHMTNTAGQIPLYQFFKVSIPTFYHLPIICNIDGKKLSKRDFGFSLNDLYKGGFLPEAICNYLAIIGGSFKQEIMDFDTLAKTVRFDNSSPKGTIKYDVEKLRWFNHQWIQRLSIEELTKRCLPFLQEQFPQATTDPRISELIAKIQPDMVTLYDAVQMLSFYFSRPEPSAETLELHRFSNYAPLLKNIEKNLHDPEAYLNALKSICKEQNIPMKEIFGLVRVLLTGKPQGLSVKDILSILGPEEAKKRLEAQ